MPKFKHYVVLQIESDDSDIYNDLEYMIDHGGEELNIQVLSAEPVDEALLALDGPPTLMYP